MKPYVIYFLLQLKVQEAMKKKDKLAREQEEVIIFNIHELCTHECCIYLFPILTKYR